MPDSVEIILQRGHAAQTLLDHETFNGVCEDLLRTAAIQWVATGEHESSAREQLHSRVRGINAVRAELQARIDDAKKTQADLDRAERRKKEI